jgi:inner membrane protein
MPKLQNNLGNKLAVIGALGLVLWTSTLLVRGLIDERKQSRLEATKEIGSKWANPQWVAGPLLVVPYTVSWKSADGKRPQMTRKHYQLPETLRISGDLVPQQRYRGIYESTVYTAAVTVHATFGPVRISASPEEQVDAHFADATVAFGVADLRGIDQAVGIEAGGRKLEAEPDIVEGPIPTGIRARFDAAAFAPTGFDVQVRLSLRGTEDFQTLPLGKETIVDLRSAWPSPSFGGAFLPRTRDIQAHGFTASWSVLHYNRNIPQTWSDAGMTWDKIKDLRFGVSLKEVADHYQKSTRAVKYAILFILLTFVTCFVLEILGGFALHPVQYLLVGAAVSLFFLLLVSLSEHLAFGLAYAIASAMTILVIVGYSWAILRGGWNVAVLGSVTVVLYVFLYVVLQLEDYALLVGSLGVFAALATVMWATRRIDWYGIGSSDRRP